jgi:hypothetical protein
MFEKSLNYQKKIYKCKKIYVDWELNPEILTRFSFKIFFNNKNFDR